MNILLTRLLQLIKILQPWMTLENIPTATIKRLDLVLSGESALLQIPKYQTEPNNEKFHFNCKLCEKWQTLRYRQPVTYMYVCWWARQYEDVYNIIINYAFLNASKPQSQSKVQCQNENKHGPKQKPPAKQHFECNSQLIMLNYIHIKRSSIFNGEPQKKHKKNKNNGCANDEQKL